MILSIIIPVFNVEKYIKQCILSVVNNNLPATDYEIIVIDDESPDRSVFIIQKLMVIYDQIKLISQQNKGLGGARNTGIQNANGKYILFLDSDDYLMGNSLNNIVNYCLKWDLDILEFGAVGVTENKKEIYRYSNKAKQINNGFQYLSNNVSMNSACNKLYNVKFLKEQGLQFIEHLFGEDFEFNTRAFYYAKRVSCVNNILGCFVQTPNSITRNSSIVKNEKLIHDLKKNIELAIVFFKTIDKKVELNKLIINERIAYLTLTLLFNMYKLNISKNIRDAYIQELKDLKVYPIKVKIKSRKKNLFKHLANIELLYGLICDVKSSLLKKN